MNEQHAAVIRECAALSHESKIAFPEVIRRLIEIGVERYHADYSRQEITFYMPDGESLVVGSSHPPQETGAAFSMAAGCVGYFVQITGRRAIYFGRDGESHIERFPAAT
jgi:uncharacterized protein YbcV (DUF1398 family)